MLMLTSLAYAEITATASSPTGGEYINFPVNFTIACGGNVTVSTGNNTAIFNATLYNNVSGTWRANQSLTNATPLGTTTFNFTENGAFADSNAYVWGVLCVNNQTNERVFSSNQSFKVDTTDPTAPTVTLPINGSVIGDLNSKTNWTQTTEANFDRYTIQYANDSDFQDVDIIRENDITTQTTLTTTLTGALPIENKFYFVRVLATDLAGNTAWQFVNTTVVVSAPNISIINFSNATYYTGANVNFSILATHQFLDTCQMFVGGVINSTNNRRINGTIVFNTTTKMSDGSYVYNFRCNNTGGNLSTYTSNNTIIIDTTPPTDFNCTNINGNANNTKTTDHVPEIRWNSTADTNAGNFTITLDDTAGFTSPEFTFNVSGSLFSAETNVRSYNSTGTGSSTGTSTGFGSSG